MNNGKFSGRDRWVLALGMLIAMPAEEQAQFVKRLPTGGDGMPAMATEFLHAVHARDGKTIKRILFTWGVLIDPNAKLADSLVAALWEMHIDSRVDFGRRKIEYCRAVEDTIEAVEVFREELESLRQAQIEATKKGLTDNQ